MKTKVIPIIIILILIGAGAYYFDRYYLKNSNSKVVEKASVDDIKTPSGEKDANVEVKSTNEFLVYLAENDGAKEILSNDVEGKDKKVLFTDKDENLKIRTVAGLAYLSREALVFVSSNGSQSGKFYIIKLDQSGKRDEIDNISEPSALAISPDGQSIIYVVFSNVEESYGNNVILVNRKGENRREIFHSEASINDLSFSPDSKSIVFIKGNTDGKSVISKVNLDSAKENEIYSSANPIPTLSWSKEDRIIFTKSDAKYTSGEIFEIDSQGGNDKKIMETQNGLGVFPNLSSDGLNIGYVAVTYADGFKKEILGDIKVSSNLGQNINKIGNGTIILGWLP